MKLSDLKLNPRNPQKFKDLSKLEKSIKEFPKMMELRPLVYEPETMFILGGNKRLICLQKLGFEKIPDNWVRSAAELTPEERKRFVVADNVGFGEWNFELLAEDYELEELTEWGLDLPETDYSDDNKEIDTDFNYTKYFFKLEYSEDEYLQLKEKIEQSGKTPEKLFYETLISI